MITALCAYEPCSKPFPLLPGRDKNQKFCSSACYHAARVAAVETLTFAGRFWQKVDTSSFDACWPWQAALHANGYGNFRATPYKPGNISAHIVSWFLATGEWPQPGIFILHTCDTPRCVRNDDAGWYDINGERRQRHGHLFAGTHADNMQDCIRKGRNGMVTHPERALEGARRFNQVHPTRPQTTGDKNGMRLHPESVLRGDRNPRHKVTEAQIEEAARLHATGQWSLAQLGKRYGVTDRAVAYRLRQYNASLKREQNT